MGAEKFIRPEIDTPLIQFEAIEHGILVPAAGEWDRIGDALGRDT